MTAAAAAGFAAQNRSSSVSYHDISSQKLTICDISLDYCSPGYFLDTMSAAIAINFGSQISFGSKQRTADTRNVAAWIRLSIATHEIDDSAVEIMVTELECNDPDCVPLETLIALLGKEARWTYKILKPLAEVTQENVNNVPFPPSWSSWVAEQTFNKKNAEIYSWMCDFVDDFDQRVKELEYKDQLQAAAIMERLIADFRCRTTDAYRDVTVIQDESSEKFVSFDSKAGIESNSEATIVSNSTMVTMKPKVLSENTISVQSIGSNRDNQYQQVISNETIALQTTGAILAPERGSIESSNSAALSENTRIDQDKGTSLKSADSSSRMIQPKKVESQNMHMLSSSSATGSLAKRHKKGTRPRGCPCCDPDSIDNIIDKMIFLETPP